MRVARYIRVSNREQKKGLERQLFRLEQCVGQLGGSLEDSPLYVDVQSGRDSDRPEFLKMLSALEGNELDVIIAYRVDRLARDLAMTARLYRLFEAGTARLYDFQRESYVDFSNPEEWESYAQRGVSAEAESRKLSKRIRSGFEFNRHKGIANSRPPWGYIRDSEAGTYKLNPELAPAVRDSVQIVLKERNFQRACRKIARRWEKQWKSNSLRKWIQNPVLRGHTGYGWSVDGGCTWSEIRYNTHPDEAVMSEADFESITNIIAENRQYWGTNSQKNAPRHPLGGLVYCARCGSKMAITLGSVRSDGTKLHYFSCRERVQWQKPEKCSMNRSLPVQRVLDEVIQRLLEANGLLADVAGQVIEMPKPPELLELEALLRNLERLGNNRALQSSKDELITQIAALKSSHRGISGEMTSNRTLLSSMFRDPLFWQTLKPDEQHQVFSSLVNRVIVDCQEIDTGQISKRKRPIIEVSWDFEIYLKPLGLPGEKVHPPSEQ